MDVFPYLCLCSTFTKCLQRLGKGLGSSRTEVTNGCEPQHGCWELNSELLQE